MQPLSMKRPAPNGTYTAATHVGRIRDVTNVVETATLTADFVVCFSLRRSCVVPTTEPRRALLRRPQVTDYTVTYRSLVQGHRGCRVTG